MTNLAVYTNGRPPAQEAALHVALSDLARRFGDGAVTRLGDIPIPLPAFSTGYPALDHALGVGGLPRGRIVDIYGPESSGKTTICLSTIAEAQKQGALAAFVDAEHALDFDYAVKCGVDPARLYLAQPDTGEEALEIVESMVRAGAGAVVVDSVPALLPRAEGDSEIGDNHAGLQSRLMAQALRKLAGPVRRHNTLLIFTNQTRYDHSTGQERPTGGMALRFHASIRLELCRLRSIKSAGQVIGARIRATVKKNKVAPPYKWAEIDLMHQE